MRISPLVIFAGTGVLSMTAGAISLAVGFPIAGVVIAGLLGLFAGIKIARVLNPAGVEDIDIDDETLTAIRYRKSRDWRGRETDDYTARGPLGALIQMATIGFSTAWRQARAATVAVIAFLVTAIALPAFLGVGGAAGRNAFFVFLACTVCIVALEIATQGRQPADSTEEDT